jgi:hypothetical protein
MRYGYCIFCDDIRTELGEKLSFMGVYNGILFLPEFPYTLPKLCAHINLVTPASEPYKSIVVECFAPGDDAPLMRENLDTLHLDEQSSTEASANGTGSIDVVVGASLIFSPLRLRRPGLLTVKAVIDGETVDISSLRIARQDEI